MNTSFNGIVIVLLTLMTPIIGYTQLTIYKGTDEKTFDQKDEMYIVYGFLSADDCCDSKRVLGNILKVTHDSVFVEAKRLETRMNDDSKSFYSKEKYSDNKTLTLGIDKSTIKVINKKPSSLKGVFVVSGGVLIFTSIVTALHGFVVDGSDNKKAMFISSGIQLGTSIALISIGNHKHKYKIRKDAWRFEY